MHGRMTMSSRVRGMVAAATALGILAVLSVLAGASWSATGSSNAAQYQYKGKVTICHHTHSKKNPTVTITVSQSAWVHHFSKIGDTQGPCASSKSHHGKSTTTPTTTTTTTTSSPGNGHGNGNGNGNGHGNGNGNGHGHGK
jgi:hypothetical protein